MEYKLASDFNTKVKDLLTREEHDDLLDILNKFLNDKDGDLEGMMSSLHRLVDSPEKFTLYDHVRFLVPLKGQQKYSRMVPSNAKPTTRAIRFQRRSHDKLGFSIRGGHEHGVGLYVSEVITSSAAAKQGLKVGDQILFINGFTLDQAIHDDAVSLVKTSVGEMTIRVRSLGMVPYKDRTTKKIKWTKVEDWSKKPHRSSADDDFVKVALRIQLGTPLGCSIRTVLDHMSNANGVFVELIKPGSLAAEIGLEPGDQIVDANGLTLAGASQQDALKALTSKTELVLTVKKAKKWDDEDDESESSAKMADMTRAVASLPTTRSAEDKAGASSGPSADALQKSEDKSNDNDLHGDDDFTYL